VAEDEKRMEKDPESMSREELEKMIAKIEKQMRAAAAELNFEMAGGASGQDDGAEEKPSGRLGCDGTSGPEEKKKIKK
jgi:excinuclease ABC subunit B